MGGRIPSAWRGTWLVDVPKTKKAGWGGGQSKRKSVGLETSAAKMFSRIVRRRMVPQMVEQCRSSQMVGIPRRSAETGSHVVRLFAERQRERTASYALVFVDAVAEFYSVVRDALRGPSRTLRCTRELFEEFGLDPVLGEELWHQLQTEAAEA